MIDRPVLIDAGPLVALLTERDQYYKRCLAEAQELPATLYSCWPAVTEAAYLLRKSGVGMASLLSRIELGRGGQK